MVVNNTVYDLLVLACGLRHSWKRRNIRKGCIEIEDWGICIHCIGFSRKFYAKACLLFNCFLVTKRILKALFSFVPWLLNFSDLPNYGSNSRKRLTLLSKCLVRSTLLPIDGKIDSFRWALTHQVLFLFLLRSHHMNLRNQPWRPQDVHTLVQNWHL